MNIDKEFVPYQPSLDMKEIGFNEPCVYYVDKDNESYIYNFETHPDEFIEWCGVNVIPTPTFSQAFRWFREKYKLEGLILPQSQGAVIDGEPIYFIAIISYENELMKELFNSTNQSDLLHYNPREEAELACLIKLIEIVKNNK